MSNRTATAPTLGVTPEWLSLRQVSRYASISERTLRGWIHSPVDPLPAVQVRGKILVRRSELDAWLGRHRVKSMEAVNIDAILKDMLRGISHGRQGVRKPKGHKFWCIVIDHQGQRKMRAVGTREAAERVRRQIEMRIALGGTAALEPQQSAMPSLAAYSQGWIETIEHERKPSTTGFYRQYLRLYVTPKFGEMSLDQIEREHVKASSSNYVPGSWPRTRSVWP